MNKYFLVVSLLVTGAALNAGSGCSSCPGSKTYTRTSSCPSGTCGSSKATVEETEEATTKAPATTADEKDAAVADKAE